MTVPGIVTNITNFGAFVDIGVKQDGLVHVSQLSNKFITDPNEVVKLNQKVTVTVTEVDVARKRIGLTMKTNIESSSPPQSAERKNIKPGKQIQKPAALDPFQAKLMELKKKFKD